MKATIIAALVASLTGGATPPSVTQPREGAPELLPYASVGGWNVLVDLDAGPGCYLIGLYARGTIVRIRKQPDGSIALGMSGLGAKAPARDVAILLDGRRISPSASEGDPARGTVLMLFGDPAFAAALASASRLVVEASGAAVANIDLGPIRQAIERQESCQWEMDRIAREADGADGGEGDRGVPGVSGGHA